MKKLLYIIFRIMGALVSIQRSNWTKIEPKFAEPVNINGEDYYKALRGYKKSDYPIVFGWYSGWTGTGTNMNNQLRGIPDSMDIVSLWGGTFSLTEAQKSDLEEVGEKKGLRVLYCQRTTNIGRSHTPAPVENDFIVDDVRYSSKDETMAAYQGRYGNYSDTSGGERKRAIRKYTWVIIDSINKYNYDGFDIDFESNFGYSGNLSGDSDRMHIFLNELSKEFGPKSGTEHVLMVDREPQTLNRELGPLLGYYVVQAYYYRSDEGHSNVLDSRFDRLLNKFSSIEGEATIFSRTVWCGDFEKHGGDGGPGFTARDGIMTYSLRGTAMYYRPGVNARIGGVDAYRFNLCRLVNDYFLMRGVIQVLNPANH